MLKTSRLNMCARPKKSATAFAKSVEPRLARASLLAVVLWDGTDIFVEVVQRGMKRVFHLPDMK